MAMIMRDIEFIKKEIEKNYSITYDKNNFAYKWFGALDKIVPKMIKSNYSHVDIIRFYIGGFRDGHFRFVRDIKTMDWANIIVTRYDKKYVVVYAADIYGDIVGSTISHIVKDKKVYTCNKFLLKYIFPFESCGGIPYHEYNYVLHANSMFLNTIAEAIIINKKSIRLHYENINFTYWHYIRNIDPNRNMFINNKFSINDIFTGVAWVNLPSFTEEFSKINDQIKNYRKYKLLIIDLRGNGGGDNNYGIAFVRNLWGTTYINSIKNFGNSGDVLIRVSKDNAKRYPGIIKATTNYDQDYILFRTYKNKSATNNIVANPVSAKIYCLIDYFTGSSSLLFLDEVLSLPNVYTIGYPTSSDTIFGDGSFLVDLPSGIGKIQAVPKIRVGQWKRLHGECYEPDYRLDDGMSDMAILNFIKNIL
jgi:Peptidase family S41